MAEFQKVVKEGKRMCEQHPSCKQCPLGELQKLDNVNAICRSLVLEHPEEAERIIMQWAAEHPVMTNGKKFEQVFGFNVATMFEVNKYGADWLNEEYKEIK